MKRKFWLWLALGAFAPVALLLGAEVIGYSDWQLRGSAPSNPASGFLRLWADNTAGAFKYLNSSGTSLTVGATVASGTATLGTSAIASAACASVVTVIATGVATTDVVVASFNGDPTAVTGYIPSTSGMLTIFAYPTSGNVNFKVCNNTGSSVTPGAITLNWRVAR